ncbi:MAG: hypothetical protein OXU36_24185 [Candidatus Poribacteria bacterium]|nr:hypothetical protein [Candidatus Poribacteria bacterium]
MELRFAESKIHYYASKYSLDYDGNIEQLVPRVKQRGCLTKYDLVELSDWMLGFHRPHEVESNQRNIERNSDSAIETITRSVLTDDSLHCLYDLEPLSGVSEVLGSAILHWFHKDPYPICSRPALSAVQIDEQSPLSFHRWRTYVKFCRDIAQRNNVEMRILDRSFMSFSQEDVN